MSQSDTSTFEISKTFNFSFIIGSFHKFPRCFIDNIFHKKKLGAAKHFTKLSLDSLASFAIIFFVAVVPRIKKIGESTAGNCRGAILQARR